jgi:L-ascorbate metabolism protein UlaG (beta-lactamase superfamily)
MRTGLRYTICAPMRIRLIRHATLVVECDGKRILVDPMLSDAGAMPPIEDSPDPRPNPLVPLPVPVGDVLRDVAAVLITHLHRDHFDDMAALTLRKHLPVLCQPEDAARLRSHGFTDVRPVETTAFWANIEFTRTGAQHGTGKIGQAMGPVSGYVLRAINREEPTLYIAGDTIWCTAVSDALTAHKPQVVVVNAGAARFLQGEPITMTADDVVDVCQAAPEARVIAVHMEAINHCGLTRKALREQLKDIHVNDQVLIPADGQELVL